VTVGITTFFRTIFGRSEEEAELKRKAEEQLRRTRNGTTSIERAKAELQEAQRKIHRRAEEIKGRTAQEEGGENGREEGRAGERASLSEG